MKRHHRNASATRRKLSFIFGGIALLLILGVILSQSFTLVPGGSTVYVPDYGTVACTQTRLECTGGICSDTNPKFQSVNQDGQSFWCGSPTISDANYYEGCDLYLQTSGAFDISSYNICNGDGTQCQASAGISTAKFGASTRTLHLRAGQKAYVDPNIATITYYLQAQVYGLAIEGAVKPKYADRCNLAQLLNDKQIATLKGSPDYAKTIAAGEINPGNFPIVFITGYKATYSDQRVIERDGESWFIEDIGTRCKVEQDTNGKYIVTNNCVADDAIECFPNIANCDKNGKLLSVTGDDANAQKACVPGTLIGSSTSRQPISADKACKLKCDSNGVPQNYDCVSIPKCSDGTVLSQNYDCVASTKLTEKAKCEAGGGKFTTSTDTKGNTTTSCDYSGGNNFLLYVIIGAVVVILVLVAIKLRTR